MSSIEMRRWFDELVPEQQRAWLEASQDGVVTEDLVETLPVQRKPGGTGGWVIGPAQMQWAAVPETLSFSQELSDFLHSQYDKRK